MLVSALRFLVTAINVSSLTCLQYERSSFWSELIYVIHLVRQELLILTELRKLISRSECLDLEQILDRDTSDSRLSLEFIDLAFILNTLSNLPYSWWAIFLSGNRRSATVA